MNEIPTEVTPEVSQPVEQDDVILPSGWAEGDDIFNENTWTGTVEKPADEPAPDAEPLSETAELEALLGIETPTTETPPPSEEKPADVVPVTPTTETPAAPTPTKLKFNAKVDHKDLSVEVDESELPTLYQKAQVTDRVQARLDEANAQLTQLNGLAKAMGYESNEALIKGAIENLRTSKMEELKAQGVPEELAKDYVDRLVSAPVQAPPPVVDPTPAPVTPPVIAVPTPQAPTRDFKVEVSDLLAVKPELRGQKLPEEVITSCIKGKMPLVAAYALFEAKQATEQAETLRRENQTLKQNAESASRAPVKGVAIGGPTDNQPEDAFLKGFNSDNWG